MRKQRARPRRATRRPPARRSCELVDADEPPLRVFFGVGRSTRSGRVRASGSRTGSGGTTSRSPRTAEGVATMSFGFETTARRGRRRRRPERQARGRHRRRVRDRHPDRRARWRERRRRGHARGPRRRRGARRSRPRSAPTCAGSTSPTSRRSRPSRATGTARCTSWSTTPAIMAMPELAAQPGRVRAAVRDQPPRALRARASACTARSRRRARASSASARARTCARRWSSTTSTSPSATTSRSWRYGQSKTANVLFAVGATARWARDGIYANALMPGGIATNLQRHMDPGYIDRVMAAGEITAQDARAGRGDLGLRRHRAGARGRRRPLLRGLRRVPGGRPARERRASRATRWTPTTPTGCGRSRRQRSGATSRWDKDHPAG